MQVGFRVISLSQGNIRLDVRDDKFQHTAEIHREEFRDPFGEPIGNETQPGLLIPHDVCGVTMIVDKQTLIKKLEELLTLLRPAS